MKLLDHLEYFKISRKTLFNFVIFSLLIYFVFHSIYGNRGMLAYFKINQRLEKSYKELEILRANRIESEHKVKLLRSNSLDKDLLDEQARNILGVANPKEQVFSREKPNNKNK